MVPVTKRPRMSIALPAVNVKNYLVQSAAQFHSKDFLQNQKDLALFINFAKFGILGDIHQQMWILEFVLVEHDGLYDEWISVIQDKFQLIPEMYHVCIRLIRESQSRLVQERAARFMMFLFSKGIHLQELDDSLFLDGLSVGQVVSKLENTSKELSLQVFKSVENYDADHVQVLIQVAATYVPVVDVNIKYGENQTTALFLAAKTGQVEVVKSLLGAPGIDVNKRSRSGWTALMAASYLGNSEIVKLLVEAPGIDVNMRINGSTPLMMAAVKGYYEVAAILIETLVVDVNAESEGGKTALMSAVTFNHLNFVRLLLQIPGIDVNKGMNGSTPLMMAAVKGYHEVVAILAETSAVDVNAQSKNGKTALMAAATLNHEKVVQLLLQIPGIDVNKQDTRGWTVLMIASAAGHVDIVRLLLQVPGIDVNKQFEGGQTALMMACSKNHAEIVKLLLEIPNIYVNALSSVGWTALIVSSAKCYPNVVKLLLQAPDIDLDIVSARDGLTAKDIAIIRGCIEIVQLLQNFAENIASHGNSKDPSFGVRGLISTQSK